MSVTSVSYPYRLISPPEGLWWRRAKEVEAESLCPSNWPSEFSQSLLLSLSRLVFPESQRGSESVSVVMSIETLIERLVRNVGLENPHRIREYLLRFSELLDVIPQAVEAAKKHFPEAQLVLDVYQDPEIADCYLVLYLRLKRYDDSVIERLEKAESEFLNRLADKAGWIQLTTDFREPEGEHVL